MVCIGVYVPKRRSEVTVCHYNTFHGHEKHSEVGLLDPARPEKLRVASKVPKTLGVGALLARTAE
jgi:hypothetical protein